MPERYYPESVYPTYTTGTSYMISGNISHTLIRTIDEYNGYVLDIDDMFITGIIASKASIGRHSTPLIQYIGCEDENVVKFKDLFVIYDCNSASQSLRFWSLFQKSLNNTEDFPQSKAIAIGSTLVMNTFSVVISLMPFIDMF